ncbi:unnamed protein product [Rhodiola kirilowii]
MMVPSGGEDPSNSMKQQTRRTISNRFNNLSEERVCRLRLSSIKA